MNLATGYLGLPLRSPFIVGASPLCDDVPAARDLQDAGAGAVVMRSLFEEQLVPPRPPPAAAGEILPAFPKPADYQFSPKQYLRQLDRLKGSLSIPVMASLNGHRLGAWEEFVRELELRGADAIELNFYQIVADLGVPADRIETEMLETVGHLVGAVRIPVAVKLSPFHSSLAQLAVALELEGASGVVVFNRFLQCDVDTEALGLRPLLSLTEPGELLLRLRWLAILSPLARCSLAASGGVYTAADAVKALLSGAHAVQLVSTLLRHGPRAIPTLRKGLEAWMRRHGFTELGQFRGRLNLQRCPNPAAFERANYIGLLQRSAPAAK